MTDYELSQIKLILAKQEELSKLIENLKAISPSLFPVKKQSKRFEIPSIQEITDHIKAMGYSVSAIDFHAFYSSKGWMVGKNKMKCWKSALVTWNRNSNQQTVNKPSTNNTFFDSMNSQDF